MTATTTQQYLGIKLDLINPAMKWSFDPQETVRQCAAAGKEVGLRFKDFVYDGNTVYFQAGNSGKKLWKFFVEYDGGADTYTVWIVLINWDFKDDNFGQAFMSPKIDDVYNDGLAQVFESLWNKKGDTSGWTEMRGKDKDEADEGIRSYVGTNKNLPI